jgi:hypothetical protein
VREACEAGEAAATQYILSQVDKKLIGSLEILVTSEKKDGITFNVDVSLELEPATGVDADDLSSQAADAALSAIDERMKKGTARGIGSKAKKVEGKGKRG